MDIPVVELTELEKLEVTRVDAVGRPANGFPVLLMKGTAAAPVAEPDEPAAPAFDHAAALALVKAIVGRKVSEEPDIAGGTAVISQIADLIIAEAQELKAGNTGEICDIQQLACAAEMIWCWRTGEEAVASGSVQPATALMQSAAETEKGGDVEDTAKGQIAKEGTSVDTENRTGDLTEVVKAAVTEAAAPLLKRVDDLESSNKALAAELAKVKATPVPGGPVLSAARPASGQDSEDYAAKARYFDEWAERVSDPAEQANYRQLAARERAKIIS